MRATVFALALFVLLAGSASAQIPDEFTNLKLLDPQIAKPELVQTMRGWANALGVRCSHCHVGPDNLRGMDFASDEKPAEQTARLMLELSRMINGEALASLPTVDAGEQAQAVSCFTCHRGMVHPPRPLDAVLRDAYDAGGLDQATAEYRQLREDHYGRGRYDFGTGIVLLANQLGETGQHDDAIAIVDLGLEFEPGSADLYASRGLALLAAGRLDEAEASLTRAAEIEPANRTAQWGLSRLEQARSGN